MKRLRLNRIAWCFALVFFLCRNLFASGIYIEGIFISGDKKTKESTILRELPFRAGDIVPKDQLNNLLKTATENLNNTSLFNYVYVDHILIPPDDDDVLACIVTIRVEERWYYWPQVSLKLEDRNLSSWLHERDFNRITIGWGLRIYNVFGLGHKVTASHYFGHEKGFRLGYYNIALNKQRTSLLAFSFSNLYNKTVNAMTENDKVVSMKDPDHFLDQSLNGMIRYSYRSEIRTTHTFDFEYHNTKLRDTVLRINKDYWGSDNLNNHAFMLSYDYAYEHRNDIVYPTTGHFIGTKIKGIATHQMRFFYGEFNLKAQYYEELFPRWFWSSRLHAGTTFKNKKAAIYDRHVGYEGKNITGYDYYVVDGQYYTILNNDMRFLLMPQRIFTIGSSEKETKFRKIHFTLYAKLAFDIGYVHNKYRHESNMLSNTFLWGSGLGIDLVTYYDIVLNCSYAVNKMGEGRFYFGIKAPIF
jgi:outer membrane protein assembly factor BamA